MVRWRQRRETARRLIVLNYHRMAPGDLDAHLRYLSRHYRIVALESALADLYAPRSPRQSSDPRLPLAITIDDGYADTYSHALPLARHWQAPMAVFLVPGYLESGDRFWWQEPSCLVRDTRRASVTIEGQSFELAYASDRRRLERALDQRLRRAASVREREAALVAARAALQAPDRIGADDTDDMANDSLTNDDPGARPMTWREVALLSAEPLITLGAHTMRHPVLACLDDTGEVASEVGECRAALEQRLGRAITTFAYPIGKLPDIGERAIAAVRTAGYRWAVTTIPGANTPATDPYLLRRVSTDPTTPVAVLAAQAVGIWHLLAPSRLFDHLRGFRRARSHPGPGHTPEQRSHTATR